MGTVPPLGNHATTPIFNTKAVVRETDVPADTFRAWERRYGVPQPHRTEGGHRLYSERDIAIIRWLRDRTAEGVNISQAVRLLQRSVAEDSPLAPSPATPRPSTTPAESAEPRALATLQAEAIAALLRFDEAHAERLLAEAFALYPFADVLLQLMQPMMIDVGDRWHRGEITIAVEHFVTQFVRRKLSGLLSVSEAGTSRGTIIVACAPGEQHDLGVLIVALFLMRRGWHVIYLGPQVPSADLLATVDAVQPALVCLAASLPETARQLADVAAMLHQHAPHVRVGYGGRIFNTDPALRATIHGTYLGHDAREVVSTVAALFDAP